jgi:predicted hydrocarbon binding protein
MGDYITMDDQKQNNAETEMISSFAYKLLRNELIPELLGKEQEAILYWAGKALARKFPLQSIEEIIDFFKQASWGELHLIKDKKQEKHFTFTPKLSSSSFKLEAGFLAEQIQQQTSFITETFEQSKRKTMYFIVKSDRKDNAVTTEQ